MFLPQLLYDRFYSGGSDNDLCTMVSDRNLVNRRNVKSDVHKAYRPNRDFLLIEVKSRIIAAAKKVFGLKSSSDCPPNLIPSAVKDQDKLQKLSFLNKMAAQVVDELVLQKNSIHRFGDSINEEHERQLKVDEQAITPEGRFPCRYEGCPKSFKFDGKSRRTHEATHNIVFDETRNDLLNTMPEQSLSEEVKKSESDDDMFNYNTALLNEGLHFMNFLDAVAEGDGDRIIRQYKFLLVRCKIDGQHSKNYALECLYLMFQIHSLLTPRDAYRVIWNRGVNNHCSKGTNIPLDLEQELSNNYVKQCIKNLGVNVTEAAVTRICKAEKSCRNMLANIDKELSRSRKSGKHTHKSNNNDLETLVKRLCEQDVFTFTAGRKFRHFQDFQRDITASLDMSAMYKWINKHEKNVTLYLKAR